MGGGREAVLGEVRKIAAAKQRPTERGASGGRAPHCNAANGTKIKKTKKDMVKVKTIMEVEAPTIKVDAEKKIVEGLRCNYCWGNGWFWNTDEYGEDFKDPCPMCGGSGKVNAEITIKWKPWKK